MAIACTACTTSTPEVTEEPPARREQTTHDGESTEFVSEETGSGEDVLRLDKIIEIFKGDIYTVTDGASYCYRRGDDVFTKIPGRGAAMVVG